MNFWNKAKTILSGISLEDRVRRYRRAGFNDDGLHTLGGYKVDDLDYQLMGADNACARINFGSDASTGQWFGIDLESELAKCSFGNSHGTSHDGGKTFLTESAYMAAPKPSCWVSVEEVVWHHKRIVELKKNGVEQPERVRIMTEERTSKPWLKGMDKAR